MASHNQGDRVEVFCSYAHEDEPLFRQLEQRLLPLQRAGRLLLRHQGQIPPGADTETTLQSWQSKAQMILLLVSPAYLASDACYHEAQRATQSSAHIIPVIFSPCHWSDTVFGGLQCLPRNKQPITSWPNQDEGWHEVTEGIRRMIDEVSLGDAPVLPQTGFVQKVDDPPALPVSDNIFAGETGTTGEFPGFLGEAPQTARPSIREESPLSRKPPESVWAGWEFLESRSLF